MEMNFFICLMQKDSKIIIICNYLVYQRNNSKKHSDKTKNSESIIMTRQTNIIEIQKGCNYNGRDFNCNHSCQFFGLDSKYYNRYRDDNCSN